jgi:hypothetical protein
MKFPRTDKERRELIKRLSREGELVAKRGSGKIPEEFWTMPRPEDPEGLALRYLIEARRDGR